MSTFLRLVALIRKTNMTYKNVPGRKANPEETQKNDKEKMQFHVSLDFPVACSASSLIYISYCVYALFKPHTVKINKPAVFEKRKSKHYWSEQ